MTKDLTCGHPLKIIINFALPVFFGYLFQQFYNIVDSVIVGQFLGVDALAAVGATGSLHFMIIGFCMGLCSGFAIPVAQRFGASDYTSMRQFIFNSWFLVLIFSLIITSFTVIFCRFMLVALKTPDNIIDMSYSYFVIILAGIPVIFFYNILSGIIRSVGDSKTPLYFLLISAVLNILLDLLFIAVFKLGIPGAAYATVISTLVSGLLCFFYMRAKFEILRLQKEDKVLSSRKMLSLMGIGVPMGLQYSITAIGSVILQSAVNVLGSVYVASMVAAQKISIFFSTPFDALGTTMATYGGQNVGAQKIERLNPGLFWGCMVGFAWSLIALLILYFFTDNMAILFISKNESAETTAFVLKHVFYFLMANGITYWLLVLVNCVRFMIQGMGFSRLAIFAGVFELIGRGLIGIVFVPLLGFPGACLASPLAWVLADAFLLPAYFSCRRKLIKMFARGGQS
ncbi:MATE family efflux transporter [Treponema sp.]|uniref:MATE family efflux transporter n=1 Tax=Treponema sp. TaxID=166 RepID=UPI0025CFDED2|nr:MATE family efflux transporter [Treponema sp.]MBR4323700.1 MATE family efflux transporter [Treponema sp.]